MDIAKVLTIKYVGKEWTLNGNDYENLEWLSDSPKPTQDELNLLWQEIEAENTGTHNGL